MKLREGWLTALVQVWARVGTKLEVLDTVECGENCDNLHQIRSRPLCERQQLFKSLLLSNESNNKFDQVPEDLKVVAMVMDHWSRHAVVSRTHIEAILLCRFVLTEVDPVVGGGRNVSKLQLQLDQLRPGQDPGYEHQLVAASCAQLFHMEEQLRQSARRYDADTVYKLAQFQATLWVSLALCQVLDTGLQTVTISQLLNCTFVYNAIFHLDRISQQADLAATKLFQKHRKVTESVLQCLDHLDRTPTTAVSGKVKRKVRTKKKLSDNNNIHTEMEAAASTSDDTDSEFHDMNNIFSLLSVG